MRACTYLGHRSEERSLVVSEMCKRKEGRKEGRREGREKEAERKEEAARERNNYDHFYHG